MMCDIMLSDILPFCVLEPVATSGVFGDKLGQVINFTLDIPVVLIEVP